MNMCTMMNLALHVARILVYIKCEGPEAIFEAEGASWIMTFKVDETCVIGILSPGTSSSNSAKNLRD